MTLPTLYPVTSNGPTGDDAIRGLIIEWTRTRMAIAKLGQLRQFNLISDDVARARLENLQTVSARRSAILARTVPPRTLATLADYLNGLGDK